MRCVNSYQDIKTPEDEREENEFESIYNSLLEEFDPEEAAANHCSFSSFQAYCRREAKRIMEQDIQQEEE